jgi:hypothetical protein
MTIRKIFKDILCVDVEIDKSSSKVVPRCLQLVYEADRRLSTSILQTDIKILPFDKYYQLDGKTIFAEESQCVVMWGFVECSDNSKCFQVVNNEPLEYYEEDDTLEAVLCGMIATNILSCDLVKFWFSTELTDGQLSKLTGLGIEKCGVLSNVQTFIYKSVVCNVEVEQPIRLNAASQSNSDLDEFKALLKECQA